MSQSPSHSQSQSQLVIIPVFNEEKHLAEILCELRKYHTGEVLVINDGSTDKTAEILGRSSCYSLNVITHGHNRGYGASLIAGFHFAFDKGFDQIVTMDADWQHQPCAVPAFFKALDSADIVSGSRYLHEYADNNAAPEARRQINTEITAQINEITGYKLTDGFCGFKAYRTAPLKRLALDEAGYAFPLQFWIQAAHHTLSVSELAVKRIYLDPTRTFGEQLNDPSVRRKHYHEVIEREAARVGRG